jgi:hypothetical protein
MVSCVPAAESGDLAVRRLQEAVGRLAAQTSGRRRTGRSHQDADDIAGTVATDDAIGYDPLPLLRAFSDAGARVAVIGQAAGIMHGSRELTGDLDLLWDGAPGQAAAVAAAFGQAGARLCADDGRPVACTAAGLGRPKVLFRTASASGDCCTPALPWGDFRADRALARCLVATGPGGFRVCYLGRADLIAMRRAAGRVKDLRRARELERLGPGSGR